MKKFAIKPGPKLVGSLLLLISSILVVSCAVVEPPPGGPIDKTPPHLVAVFPDSGSLGLGETTVLHFTFSEKMDRANAFSWLYFFPDQRIRKTKWHGATVADVYLEEPLPADTLIVVEVAGSMRDAHKVKNKHSRRFPISTGDSIPSGTLAGVLLYEEGPLANGVVELYGLQPDSVEYFRRPMIRRTVTNNQGAFRFDWLPVPSGPFLVRAFQDGDSNLRPGENDPQRILPDTLTVSAETGTASAGVTTLYSSNAPGRLLADAFTPSRFEGTVMAWAMSITDADTGYTPSPAGAGDEVFGYLDSLSGGVIEEVSPGLNRVLAFVDIDADSSFSAVPDSLLPDFITTYEDTVLWYLEPWVLMEGIPLEPGLSTEFQLSAWTDSLTIWHAPEPVFTRVDSLGNALTDSMAAAWGDTLFPALDDTLLTAPLDSIPLEKK